MIAVCVASGENTCRKCGIAKPLQEFDKCSRMKLGVINDCKPCKRAIWREWATKNAASLALYREATKKRDAARQKAWHKAHQTRRAAQQRKRRKANPEKRRETERRYRERNREKWLAKKRRYTQRHSETIYINGKIYAGVKRQAAVKWASRTAMQAIYDEARVLRDATGQEWTVDHIVPLRGKTACGLHNEFNLRLMLSAENKSKGNKLIPELAEAMPAGCA